MSFNSDPTKPFKEIIIFLARIFKPSHPPLTKAKGENEHEHLGLTIGPKLSFSKHIND